MSLREGLFLGAQLALQQEQERFHPEVFHDGVGGGSYFLAAIADEDMARGRAAGSAFLFWM